MRRPVLNALLQAQSSRIPAVLVSDLKTGEQWLSVNGRFETALPDDVPALAEAVDRAVLQDKAQTVDAEGRRFFINPYNPSKRMLIVGAVHISQALAPMAALSGFDVTVIDPRTAWATEERFPGVKLDLRWPDEAMEESPPDRGTAIVTLTHDPKIDDPALEVGLRSDAFYIGCLGSKRTHAKRVDRLKESGLTDAEIAKIHAPVGLDLGAVSPAEIAVATLAQVTLALRGPRREPAA